MFYLHNVLFTQRNFNDLSKEEINIKFKREMKYSL